MVRKYWDEGVWEGGSRDKTDRLVGFESFLQFRAGLEPIRKIADKGDHGGMPQPVKTKVHHFRERLLGGPILKCDAIGSDHNAGAVSPELTMDKKGLRGRIAKDLEVVGKLRIGWIGKPTDGNPQKLDAEGFRTLLLDFGGARGFRAKIDDGGDSQILQLV